MVIMNDLEWPMHSYYVIYYEKIKKVMQQTEKEALLYRNGTFYSHSKTGELFKLSVAF